MNQIFHLNFFYLFSPFSLLKSFDFQNSMKESPTVSAVLNGSTDIRDKSTLNCDSTDTSIDDMEPLCIEDLASKNFKTKVPQLTGIRDTEMVDKG